MKSNKKTYLISVLLLISVLIFPINGISSEINIDNVKNAIVVETNTGSIIINTIGVSPRDYEIIIPNNDKEIIQALITTRTLAKKQKYLTEEGELKYSGGRIFLIGGAVEATHYTGVKIKKNGQTLLFDNKKIGIVIGVFEKNISVLWKKQEYCVEKENTQYACSKKSITVDPFVFEIAASSLRRVYDY